ncbi:head-tail adaptor Ad1 [Ruegeria phage DSS3-P1]|uniref:head-tail adaptor Ad1 n=1 Tax=Ruegeria phage DSS3-P1 TaxID=1555208 RepID=UPI0002357CF9|nr:head-tail adaptor Ad1 [Ruegeria phage DSS3-P1]YP_009997197.1 head-tail adaptor Ad1 [Ruegeria phage vB_RpoS-V16]YP_009997277.1 head-tail adaptor Ad1 [Ruegeria phage vB_RpoS-V18]YP_009997359.1 head-tail adaptor Ad1 [Ruegeria phage vB_RpoS-V11]YP_009997442.1 head-tail adaptor Ad1 [Ruegeria phage vB_RpoS-V7]AET42273.1 hypothetical protein SDSG_00007 [Ruegeria phage DSS3-P1]AIT13295.1 head-to-tail joining protein [Ruegeria phage DSS3-P1]AWY08764.1 head-to-tail joining protein [Ruegeria phage v
MTLAEQLADAKAQYHLLVTGQQAKVFVDQNGERVEYTAANRSALLAYIQRLENQVNATTSGPMRILM